jgi:hypothetical protein
LPTPAFVEVIPSNPPKTDAIEILLRGNRRLRVGVEFDRQLLLELIHTLEALGDCPPVTGRDESLSLDAYLAADGAGGHAVLHTFTTTILDCWSQYEGAGSLRMGLMTRRRA